MPGDSVNTDPMTILALLKGRLASQIGGVESALRGGHTGVVEAKPKADDCLATRFEAARPSDRENGDLGDLVSSNIGEVTGSGERTLGDGDARGEDILPGRGGAV